MWLGPGVHVVALVPVAGPVPPPNRVVMPEAIASRASCGQMKCTWASSAPEVRMSPSPAMASVDAPTTIPFQRNASLWTKPILLLYIDAAPLHRRYKFSFHVYKNLDEISKVVNKLVACPPCKFFKYND